MTRIVDAADGERITNLPDRKLILLSTTPSLTLTWTRHGPGQEGTDLHVHREHTDAFFVLDGELSVPLGPRGEPVPLAAGSFAAIPPDVAHAFVNASDADVSFLNLHTPDGGFIDFLNGLRKGEFPAWDSFPPPRDGGRPGEEALIEADGAAALARAGVTVLHADMETLRLELRD